MATIDELLAKELTPSRFSRLMTPSNILDDIRELKHSTTMQRRDIDEIKKDPKAKPTIIGTVPGDAQFEAQLEFGEKPAAPDFDVTEPVYWTEPLIDPKEAPTYYYVRIRISQHMVNPLLQGFRVQWIKPPGWSWMDGLGDITTDEAISNPLAVVRLVQRSGALSTKGFHARVIEKFLP